MSSFHCLDACCHLAFGLKWSQLTSPPWIAFDWLTPKVKTLAFRILDPPSMSDLTAKSLDDVFDEVDHLIRYFRRCMLSVFFLDFYGFCLFFLISSEYWILLRLKCFFMGNCIDFILANINYKHPTYNPKALLQSLHLLYSIWYVTHLQLSCKNIICRYMPQLHLCKISALYHDPLPIIFKTPYFCPYFLSRPCDSRSLKAHKVVFCGFTQAGDESGLLG